MDQKELETFVNIKLLEAGRVSQKKAAAMIGTTQSNFNRKLKAGTLSYLEIYRLADHLGYKVEWVKKEE